jgi:hypothetical protein
MFEFIAQRTDGFHLVKPFGSKLRRTAQRHDVGNGFRSGPAAAFLLAPKLLCRQPYMPGNIQCADAFGRMQLVAGK